MGPGGVADAINHALTMSTLNKKKRLIDLYKHVTVHTVQAWTTAYTEKLLTTLSCRKQLHYNPNLAGKESCNTLKRESEKAVVS